MVDGTPITAVSSVYRFLSNGPRPKNKVVANYVLEGYTLQTLSSEIKTYFVVHT